MWRRCIEIFAAGAWHDRLRHVVQRRLELDGHVCFKWCETCMPSWPYTRRSHATGGWWCCETTLTTGFVVHSSS